MQDSMKDLAKEILEILESDARSTPSEIATLLGTSEEEVAKEIRRLEESGIIRKYMTMINWDKVDDGYVYAVIELKVALRRDKGYDAIAERISRFSEVQSVRLVSGDHDISFTVRGRSMKEVAFFVTDKIAALEQDNPQPE